MTIWDRLWAIDPANMGQKPRHEWVVVDGKRVPRLLETPFPVHDGQNEGRFNSTDALFDLADRLGMLAGVDMAVPEWAHQGKHYARASLLLGDTMCGEFGNDRRLALATAILKAMGVAV